MSRFPFLNAMRRKGGLTFWPMALHLAFILIPVAIAAALFAAIRSDPTRSGDYPGMIIPLAWAVALTVAFMVRTNRSRSALDYEISLWGDYHQISALIEADFEGRRPDGAPVQVGEAWLCYVRGEDAYVMPLEVLAWAHQDIRSVVLDLRNGHRRSLPMGALRARDALKEIRYRAPWVMVGSSQVLENSWIDDRADVVRKVDQARAERRRFSEVAGKLANYLDD